MKFFAIYRDGEHISNVRQYNAKKAIRFHLKDCEPYIGKKTLEHYSAILAIEGIHYFMTAKEKKQAIENGECILTIKDFNLNLEPYKSLGIKKKRWKIPFKRFSLTFNIFWQKTRQKSYELLHRKDT